jgi:hypothetical protein
MAHPGGRPTKYKKDTNEKAVGYIATCGENYLTIDKPVIKDGKVETETIVKKEIKLPTIQGLSLLLDVNADTLYEWAKHYPEFSDTLGKLKKKQAEMLMQYGLSGEYNSTIAKLILSANHGMNEKTESESTVKVTDETISPEDKQSLLALLNEQKSS